MPHFPKITLNQSKRPHSMMRLPLKQQEELWRKHFASGKYDEVYPSEQVVRFLKRAQEDRSAKTVLDLGCGVGRHALLAAELGFDVVAIDIADSALEKAKGRLAQRNYKGVFKLGRVENIPCNDESADLIVSYGVFDHVSAESAEAGMREARRVLKKKGLYFLKLETDRSPEIRHGTKVAEGVYILNRDCERDVIQRYYSIADVRKLLEPFTVKRVELEEQTDILANEVIRSRWLITAQKQ